MVFLSRLPFAPKLQRQLHLLYAKNNTFSPGFHLNLIEA